MYGVFFAKYFLDASSNFLESQLVAKQLVQAITQFGTQLLVKAQRVIFTLLCLLKQTRNNGPHL